ncbi:putative receptor-like serine/threonine-protein kinase ALE2-like [Capsicum annuum]|uniref:NDR1/HIN1-like protein 13 n=1 Tax=Capsicum annuum TaxID=4072 RepID=UPI0007BF5378|nr:NDR1/HIN1-like protein 13 [Capsicum annuum]KAF3647774.1 putative receptor-like serine/threonine-protein kinase ALE2-like [Capsicum annuum]KAF3655185.1 putative receptor-like serine/threonine-protein kinase ALE2-like [Capsicum annuum]
MADRVYPAAKPATTNGTAAAPATTGGDGGANPAFPANKAQLYNAARPTYRPVPPPRRKHRRSCCCCCCLFITFLIVILILLAAIAGAIFWVLYRPQRPSFSVSTLQVSQFNLTSTKLASKFNLSIVARNPNKKISFLYDPINISFNSDDSEIGSGSLPAFTHDTKNTTTLKTVVSSSGTTLDDSVISTLRSKLNKKKNLPLEIKLDTKVKVKIGSLKTTKVGIRVNCDGIKITVPSGKTPTKATTSDVKCKVDLRIKIWKWTL